MTGFTDETIHGLADAIRHINDDDDWCDVQRVKTILESPVFLAALGDRAKRHCICNISFTAVDLPDLVFEEDD